MRERRGRKGNPKSLDPVEDGKGFFGCYILTSLSPRHKGHTYVGFTVNPRRRIRQHNGEITSGAWRTKRKRPWEMVLCIYGFPSNVSALQFEWAWQHPRESLAVREAAAAFKSFSGLATKIKLAYTMLNLPSWNSLNLTLNYFSSKYAHHGGLSPSLPSHMKVQVCPMDDLPCFAKVDNISQQEEDDGSSSSQSLPVNSPDKEEDDSPPGDSSTSSSNDLHTGENAKTVFNDDDRLANFTGFPLLDEIVEDQISPTTQGSDKAMEKDCWIKSNLITSTSEVEVIDLMTPSPTCRVGSMKRPRVSEFIDLTMSPNFVEL